MPIYTVKNKESEETKDVMCSYDDRKKWLKDNLGGLYLYTFFSPHSKINRRLMSKSLNK